MLVRDLEMIEMRKSDKIAPDKWQCVPENNHTHAHASHLTKTTPAGMPLGVLTIRKYKVESDDEPFNMNIYR